MAAKGAWTGKPLQGAAVGALALFGLAAAWAPAHAQDATPVFSDLGLRGAEAPSANSIPAPFPVSANDDQSSDQSSDSDPNSNDGLEPPEPADQQNATPNSRSTPNPDAANYGKPKPTLDPTLNYAGRRKPFRNPLPTLEPYATAPVLRRRGGPSADPDDAAPPPSIALPPRILTKKPPIPEADPYAPLGVDVGSLRLTPYVETDLGYDSNPARVSTGAKGSPVLRGEVGVSETSLWSSNQLTANLEAGYSDYLKQHSASRPDGTGKVDLRVDASRDTALDFELRGALTTQQPGAPGLSSSLVGEPLILAYGGTAGVTQTLSRLTLGLHGLIDRYDYQDGRLADGTIDPLSSENYNDYTIKTHAGYELTPGFIPFVEVDADTRKHDQTIDASGFARNSTGITGQIGTTFEFSRILTGSASGGYLERAYQDPRLGRLMAPVFNSSLVWVATPLTTLTLNAATTVNETTANNAAGEVSRNVSLGVSHALLRNLTLTGLASYQINDYPGTTIIEHDYLGTFGVQYSLTRSVVLKGTFTHERLLSTNPGSSYTDNVIMLGLRLQR